MWLILVMYLCTQKTWNLIKLIGLVFDAHRQAGIRLKANKTHLFQEEVKYLRHLVSLDGIKLIPSYVQKVIDWQLPQTGKELSAFLDFTNYYRDFLPGFENVTANLNNVKNCRTITWTPEMENNFNTLKQMFATALRQATPDFSPTANPFI